MDVTRDRMVKRFDMALQKSLHEIETTAKIFTKNHRFKNELIKRDLRNIIDSGKKMALGDLTALENKKAIRGNETISSETRRPDTRLTSVITSRTPRSKKTHGLKLPNILNCSKDSLPPSSRMESLPKDSIPNSSRRENIILPAITLPRYTDMTSTQEKQTSVTKVNGQDEQPLKCHPFSPEDKDSETRETNNPGSAVIPATLNRWKLATKLIGNDQGKGLSNTEKVAPVSKIKESGDDVDKLGHQSRRTSDSHHEQNDQTVNTQKKENGSMLWRRLSVDRNRRQSMRKCSITADQAVRAFIEMLQSKSKTNGAQEEEDERKKYDLSYLYDCRYLRIRHRPT